jgi:muconolactone delta-isomerase
MLFLFQVGLKKPADMSNGEFYGLWDREADAVVGALAPGGAVKWAYKIAGEPRIVAVMEFKSHDEIDQLIHGLPIWRQGFSHLLEGLTWTPLREYENWHGQLRELAKA